MVIHERFEKILKWVLRLIAFIGIATSVIAIDQWYVSLGVTILIFLIEQFFETTAIEYTTMVVQPFPDFEVKYDQWKTNGFMIPQEKNDAGLAYFGPAYADKEYAIKFFQYLRSWVNHSSNDDTENNLVISLVIEPNEEYTTYLYANPGRKRLDTMFKFMGNQSKLEKYGKRQQEFIAQMTYWNTLDFKDGYFIKKFLDFQKTNEPFIFLPCVVPKDGKPMEFLFDHGIKKYEFQVRHRYEVQKDELEDVFNPQKYND
ncbi:MAG: hypothetical protein AB7O73_01615 [Bacteroidia bacterium]